MKHSGLIKILAVILAVLSLSQLVSGVYGLYTASRDRKKETAELERIQDTTDDYRSVLARRMDPEEYAELSHSLETRQKTYDSDMTKHRKDLAAFTATRGAMETAEEALARSEAALQTARTQYETGKKTLELEEKTFRKLYDQVMDAKSLLDEGTALLNAAESTVSLLKNVLVVLNGLEKLAEMPDTDEEDIAAARKETALAAYDAAIAAYGDAVSLVETLQDREIPVSQLKQALGLSDDASAEEVKEALKQYGIELTDEQMQALEGDSIILLSSQQVEEFKHSIEAATGMSMDDLLAKMQSERDAIANGDDGLSEEQFETIRKAFADNLSAIQRTSAAIENAIPALEETLNSAQEKLGQLDAMFQQMESAKKQIDKAKASLEEAGRMLAQGELALEEGKKQLKEQQEKLDEQAETLEKEKLRLDEEDRELKEMGEKVDEQKELEERERSLRQALLADMEIREKTDAGTELIPAAEERINAFGSRLRQEYGARFGGCLTMLSAVIFAFLAAAAAFREEEIGKLFLTADVLCTVCCSAAVWAFLAAGRGISYSALTTGCAAAATLISAFFMTKHDPGKVYN